MSLLLLLIVALILDALFGEPDWLWARIPHPAVLMGKAVAWLDRSMNFGGHRKLRGVAACAVLVSGAGAIGNIIAWVPDFGLLEMLGAAILLAQRSLTEHVGAVAGGLQKGIDEGRKAVGMIVGRRTDTLDETGVARAAIESGAENLSDGVVAPAFWFLIGGLPGILIYKAINTADSMIGYRNAQYGEFGWAAARLDDLVNLIPARITGVLIALATTSKRVFQVMWRDARKHRSPNAGWPESAMAAALGVALSGPRQYPEGLSNDPYLNSEGRHHVNATDITHSVHLLWVAWGIGVGLLTVIWIL